MMSINQTSLTLCITMVLGLMLNILSVIGTPQVHAADKKLSLLVFTANWCASCRDLTPIVRQLAADNNLTLREIDVDHQSAPKQAKSYGLSIPSSDPPQVYLLSNGDARLIFDGRNYAYGQQDVVRETIMKNLSYGLSGN